MSGYWYWLDPERPVERGWRLYRQWDYVLNTSRDTPEYRRDMKERLDAARLRARASKPTEPEQMGFAW